MGDADTAAGDWPDRAQGALLGLAVGDAVGTTLEFRKRDTYAHIDDMVGGGPFDLEAGQWTDDTSMALCLADSLIANGRLEPRDLMDRFVAWWRRGENSPTGECVDIGIITSNALSHYEQTGEPLAGSTAEMSAGNGSLMRLAPVALFYRGDRGAALEAARLQSRTTHAEPRAVAACALFAELLIEAIGGAPGESVLVPRPWPEAPDIDAVSRGSWRDKGREEISSEGYVVDTLEAALWCVERARGFREAVLTAANLGCDADTVAAVTGQLAGALWGRSGIPGDWLARLAWRAEIEDRALRLVGARSAR